MSDHENICAITGANGWLGRCVAAALRRRGWRVRALVRTPAPDGVPFQLGAAVPAEALAGCAALVHCAYDFRARTREEIHAINVQGAEKLFAAARAAGVEKITAISTMSAFGGCVSLYGQAKLAIEHAALAAGALVLRPGLIHGEDAGAMFGRLVAQVRRARFVPLVGGGAVLHLIHERDLSDFIARFCTGEIATPNFPLTAAHEHGWTFRQILAALARAHDRRPAFVPVPWRLVWLALKAAEFCRVPLAFRSDSLVSLLNQNPHPDFSANAQFGLACRAFEPAAARTVPQSPLVE